MAKMKDLEQRVVLVFENTQANNRLVELTEKVTKLRAEYNRMKEAGEDGSPAFTKAMKEMVAQIEATEQEMGKIVAVIKSTDSVLQELSGQSVRTLATARNQLRQQIRGWSPESGEEKDLEKMIEGFEEVSNRINELRAGFNKPLEAAQDTTGMTVNRMEKLIEVLKASQTAVAKNKEKWDEYGEAIKKVNADMEALKGMDAPTRKEAAMKVVSQPFDYSIDEIRQAVKTLEELQDKQKLSKTEWASMSESIQKAKAHIQDFADSAKMDAMTKQFERLEHLSVNALAEQKKYWEGVYNSAEKTSEAYNVAEENLLRMKELSDARLRIDAREVMFDVKNGQFSGTVEQTQEAIKLLKEYNTKLNDIDSDAFKETEEVISMLNLQLNTATQNLMSYDEASGKLARMTALENEQKGDKARELTEAEKEEWKQLSKEVDRVRKSIEAYKKSLKDGDTEKLEKVNEELRESQIYANRATAEIEDMNDFLNNKLHTASLDQLQVAAQELQQRISRVERGTEEYINTTAKMRQVNSRIKSITKDMEDQGSVIEKTAKRLTSYVAVYGAYNLVAGKVREFFQGNVQLSDAMADVQKTTGMTADEVANLGKQLDAMDTRTSQQQLYELAATAGQLGIRGEEDIMGFVNASNMITVALNELGSEGTASLMKIATLTGEIASEGTEGALLKIGSAINELTANSAATAGPIVDFISRIGGVGSAAGVATHEMAAMGATFNQLNQETEVAGTAVNQMLTALTSAVRSQSMGFAQALNVDLQALTDLVNQGKSMEALVMVFESLQKSGNISAAALKALGSEGTRNNRIVTSLVENIDVLKTNLDLSAQAFEDNVSIQNEYNVKNENAAALLERIKNIIVETFTNPVVVERITGWLQSLKETVEWLVKSEGAWFALKTVIAQFIAIKVATNLMEMKRACKELAVEVTLLAKNFGNFKAGMILLGKEMLALVRGTTTLKNVWTAFNLVLKSNPIMTVVSIVTAAAGAIYAFTRNTKEASEVTEEFARNETKLANQFSKTTNEAETLVGKIRALKVEDKERSRLIAEFNSKYSKYLGYMLQDKATTDEVTAAYKLLNRELEKDYQLRLLKLQTQNLDKDYVEGQAKYIKAIREELKDAGVEDTVITKTIGYINTLVAKGETLSGVLKYIKENAGVDIPAFEQKTTTVGRKTTTTSVATDWGEALSNYVEYGRQYKKAREELTVQEETANKEAAKDIYKQQKQYLDKEYANLKAMTGTEGEELEKRKTAYTNFYNTLNGYLKSATGKQKEELQSFMDTFKLEASAIDQLRPIVDMWGKGSNLENWTTFGDVIKNLNTASPESLVAALEKMEAETQGISESALSTFNQINHTEFDTSNLEAFNADVFKAAQKLRNRLKELNRDTSGNFLWGNEGGGNKKTAKQMYDGWLAALEAYYNERETLIRQKGMEQNRLESEINRELEALNAEKLANQRELEEGLLNDLYSNSTFDPKKFKGVITNTDYFADLTLESMRSIVSAGGPKLDAVIRKNLTERMVKLEEQAYKIKQRIDKILLEDNFTEKVSQQYLESLDQLGLLFNIYTESQDNRTEEEGERRLAYMRDWSEKAYTLTASELEKEMKANALFGDWVINRKKEDYEALLIQLRKFHDDQEEAEKKAADRRKKIFDNSETGLNLQKSAKEAEQQAGAVVKSEQDEAKTWDRFKGMDLVSDDVIDEKQIEVSEAQIALYQAKIDASNLYIEQLKLEMAVEKQKAMDAIMYAEQELARKRAFGVDTTEAEAAVLAAKQNFESLKRQEALITKEEEDKISEARAGQVEEYQNIADRYVSIEQNKMSRMKEYTDAIVAFSGQMGEAAFGEVEDRKEAGKQLIKTLLTTLKEHMQVKLTELVMEKLFAEQSVATTAGQVSTELSLTGAKTSADIAAGTASATAKEAGSKGWIGLAIGAAIGAALSALLGLAMGAINKSKSVADSISGKKKLATGMLTYAEGNYPVLGNDGKVYDAKYEGSNLKTGVYKGGAHFGIFSEKQPEMIVDGKTTQKLILNYPHIYDAITTIAKHGRLVNAMPTFAAGDYPAGLARLAGTDASAVAMEDEEAIAREERTNALLEQNTAAFNRFIRMMESGITAHVDGLENYKQQKKNERFLKRRGID